MTNSFGPTPQVGLSVGQWADVAAFVVAEALDPHGTTVSQGEALRWLEALRSAVPNGVAGGSSKPDTQSRGDQP